MEIVGTVYAEKKTAGSAIMEACHAMKNPDPVPLGKYRGFAMELYFDPLSREYGISVFENPQKRGKHYGQHDAERNGYGETLVH